jgi:hypothetical protein
LTDIKTFDDACLKYKVTFTREELRKIKKLFGEEDDLATVRDGDLINFH